MKETNNGLNRQILTTPFDLPLYIASKGEKNAQTLKLHFASQENGKALKSKKVRSNNGLSASFTQKEGK